MNRQWLDVVSRVVELPHQPRAVVVLIGWWGASPKHVAKYAALYHKRNCVTVQGTLSTLSTLTKHDPTIDEFAKELTSKVAKTIRSYESCTGSSISSSGSDVHDKIPVLVHAFSNGGAFVVERWERLLEAETQTKQENSNNNTNKQKTTGTTDLRLVARHWKGQIFDSAPAYPSLENGQKALTSTIPNPLLHGPLLLLGYFWVWIVGRTEATQKWMDFWNNVKTSSFFRTQQQAFIYSQDDALTPVAPLEKLIEARRSKNEGEPIVVRLEASPHVQHLRTNPVAYNEFIDTCLDRWTPEKKNL